MVLTRLSLLVAMSSIAGLAACVPAVRGPATPVARPITLVDTSGGTTTMPADFARSKLTVLVFYSDHCPCFRVHEERLRSLAQDYGAQGVRVIFVDSEVSATLDRDGRAATERALPPIAIDTGAVLADSLDADYATYTVVFDAQGQIQYRGGIDSDKDRLHPDARPYVRDALDDILAGRAPRRPEGKALGCALQKH